MCNVHETLEASGEGIESIDEKCPDDHEPSRDQKQYEDHHQQFIVAPVLVKTSNHYNIQPSTVIHKNCLGISFGQYCSKSMHYLSYLA